MMEHLFIKVVYRDRAWALEKYGPQKHHKMVKHTQITCPEEPESCLSVFGHFEGFAIKAEV